MANQVLLGYNPNDFFYISASDSMPADCDSLNPYAGYWDISCGTAINPATSNTYFQDNAEQCVQKELCKNKDAALKLAEKQNRQLGGDEKYMDSKIKYDNVLMDVINLGIGIFFAIFLIYRNQSVKK